MTVRYTTTDATANSGVIKRQYYWAQGLIEHYSSVQVEIVGAATVTLVGRRAADLPWRTLYSWVGAASSAITGVAMLPEMRIEVTGNTGSVTVDMEGDLA